MDSAERPLMVVRDIDSRLILLGLCAVAVGFIAWSVWQGREVDDWMVMAWGLLAATLLLLLRGSREITLYEERLVVVRRGRVVLDRALAEIVAVRKLPFTELYWVVFSGSQRVWLVANRDDWGFVVEHCQARVRRG